MVEVRDRSFSRTRLVLTTPSAEFLPPPSGNASAKISWAEEPFVMSPVRDVSDSALAWASLDKAVEWAREMLPGLAGAEVTAIRSYW